MEPLEEEKIVALAKAEVLARMIELSLHCYRVGLNSPLMTEFEKLTMRMNSIHRENDNQ